MNINRQFLPTDSAFKPEGGIPETLGGRVKRAQLAAGLSNEALAAAAGVSVQSISYWRNDQRAPSDENLETLARVLGCSISWLRYGEERASGTSGESAAVPADRALPHRVRVWLKEFELELAKGGANDDEIAAARALLMSPESFAFYVGGQMREATDDEIILSMEALAKFIRDRLRQLGRKIR